MAMPAGLMPVGMVTTPGFREAGDGAPAPPPHAPSRSTPTATSAATGPAPVFRMPAEAPALVTRSGRLAPVAGGQVDAGGLLAGDRGRLLDPGHAHLVPGRGGERLDQSGDRRSEQRPPEPEQLAPCHKGDQRHGGMHADRPAHDTGSDHVPLDDV